MKILAVDDEKLALEVLENTILEVVPGADVFSFRKPLEAIEFAETTPIDIAFLDIKMRGMNGLELAKKLKDIKGNTNIIFVTGYSEYSLDAFRLYASDYLLKPVDAQQVKDALDNLRNPVQPAKSSKIKIRCFGNFEVFVNGMPLSFCRSKTKEMFAYLIDRRGTSCDMKELMAVLWEDMPESISQRSNLRNLIYDLKNTLSNVNADDVVIKGRNTISINPDAVDCDYFDFLRGNPYAVNQYQGDYMKQYSWAEMTNGTLLITKRKSGK